MSVAIRAITRLQEADDVNVTLGAGVDEYALCWDNDTARFVLRAVATGGLLATGATTGATAQAQAFTNGIVGPSWKPAADSATALQMQNAAGASVLNVDTTNNWVGIGTTAPSYALHVVVPSRALLCSSGAAGAGSAFWQVVDNPNPARGNYVFFGVDRLGSSGFGVHGVMLSTGANSGGAALPILIHNYDNREIIFANANTERMRVHVGGNVGIGIAAPGSKLHALLTSAATNAVTNVLTIGHDTSGTAANGFGAGQLFALESSTTAAQSAARIQALWNEATHATRKADLVLTAYDTAEREGLRIRGNGSAPAIGFLGATPAERIAHVADPTGGGTVDAEARSAINSILATLETFGFHATS